MFPSSQMELKSHVSLGMNNLLSLEQENDISVSLKLLLCLEMMLWSGCSGLSRIDRSLLSTHHAATIVSLSSSIPTTKLAFLCIFSRCETLFYASAPRPHPETLKSTINSLLLLLLRWNCLDSHHSTKSAISFLYSSSCPLLIKPTTAVVSVTFCS